MPVLHRVRLPRPDRDRTRDRPPRAPRCPTSGPCSRLDRDVGPAAPPATGSHPHGQRRDRVSLPAEADDVEVPTGAHGSGERAPPVCRRARRRIGHMALELDRIGDARGALRRRCDAGTNGHQQKRDRPALRHPYSLPCLLSGGLAPPPCGSKHLIQPEVAKVFRSRPDPASGGRGVAESGNFVS